MTPSQDCIELIQEFESCLEPTGNGRYRPYLCPAGVPTIGWGTIKYPWGNRVTMQDGTITRAEADDYFEFELNEKAEGVEELLDVEVTQGQFDALVSFAYNVGTGALRKSTLLRLLNEGRHWEAGNQFPRWNRGGGRVLAGLTRRRRSEQRLYMGLPFELAYVTNQEFNQLYK